MNLDDDNAIISTLRIDVNPSTYVFLIIFNFSFIFVFKYHLYY